ncbi:MAG: DPP IV N-terminal domain-containing protein [Armatimonadetes bacterium]|nr:DPP IV N-terminal domain-containing protein [Armatimonadota bacterium]
MNRSSLILLTMPVFLLGSSLALGQGTQADYDRANGFREQFRGLVRNERISPTWIGNTSKFWYVRQEEGGGKTFLLVDPLSGKRAPAFDHAKVAAVASKITGRTVAADQLPFTRLDFSPDMNKLDVQIGQKTYQIDLKTYEYKEAPLDIKAGGLKAYPPEQPPRIDGGGDQTSIRFLNQSNETLVISWLSEGRAVEYKRLEAGGDWESNTFVGHLWLVSKPDSTRLAIYGAEAKAGVAILDGKRVPFTPRRQRGGESPDGKWRVVFRDSNAYLVNADSNEEKPLSTDGSKSNAYGGRVWWSPDSKHAALYQTEPEESHPLNIVVTTPKDQFQPRLMTQQYLKPGDRMAKPHLRILDVAAAKLTPVAEDLYNNPYDVDGEDWLTNDEFVFRYNQRGHQVMRLVGVDAASGKARALATEEAKTFIDWTNKTFYQILPDHHHAIWQSERSGWSQLYMADLDGGTMTPITKGDWVMRQVVEVDTDKKVIWFMASGQTAGEDPYHLHFCRVNFDGTGFVRLTAADGTHSVEFSPDHRVIFDTYSRVDLAPTFEVRDASTGKKLVDVEQADISALTKAGFKIPQRFVAKARDGKTDIWGLVYLPTNFDPSKKYPVIEDIYAGPQGSFVPKTFHTYAGGMAVAELGFIVVRIDGMGTNNRGKAFHDVCYKNLVDAGLPDRILWMQAAAKKWTQMDLTRVGIYGTSAGGQNALDAILTHGEFYKAAMTDCGCYDNRMDKLWWNEQWMGWPIGPEYEAQSGRTLAKNLTGKLLMMVGEEDTNVDPASTYQVIDALEKAGKDFEFVPVMNNGHGAVGSPYARRRFWDFMVRNLLGVEPRAK